MPPISVTAIEPDGTGGWLLEWHDPVNLDGQPLTAYYHLTAATCAELCAVRELTDSPHNRLDEAVAGAAERAAQVAAGVPPPDATPDNLPAEAAAWLDGYTEHVQDCIDRHRLNVKGGAPHRVLEAARAGEPVPARWRRKTAGQLDGFITARRATASPPPA